MHIILSLIDAVDRQRNALQAHLAPQLWAPDSFDRLYSGTSDFHVDVQVNSLASSDDAHYPIGSVKLPY